LTGGKIPFKLGSDTFWISSGFYGLKKLLSLAGGRKSPRNDLQARLAKPSSGSRLWGADSFSNNHRNPMVGEKGTLKENLAYGKIQG
jgi:hypothetical protein